MFRPSAFCFGVVLSLALACGGATTATNNNSNTGNTGNNGSNGGNTNPNVPASIEITPAGPLNFEVLGATQLVTAIVKNSSGASVAANVTWASDAPAVASEQLSDGAAHAAAGAGEHHSGN